jgi:two-component system, OmpR family, response regulator
MNKQPLRIVIADDDRDTVTSLAAILRAEGHDVSEVYRGDAVIDRVRTYRPDAILLDIGMPGLTGFEIARLLRRELGEACPLLVAVTAWNQGSAKVLGKLVGFSHYLTKPYSTGEVLGILEPLAVSGRPL